MMNALVGIEPPHTDGIQLVDENNSGERAIEHGG